MQFRLGVSCRAAISKDNVIWTEVCISAADGGHRHRLGWPRQLFITPFVEQFPAELCECRH